MTDTKIQNYNLTPLRLTVNDPLPTHGTRGVHRVLASETSKARFTEDVVARLHFVWLVKQVQTDRTDERMVEVVKLGLGLENVL